MALLFYILIAIVLIVILLIIFLPRGVAYKETIRIDAPVGEVYDHIRFQERLMRWSAWPEATGATCSVAGNDGEVGAQTVFFNRGKRFGHQEIVELDPPHEIALTLEDSGPLKHTPRLVFHLEAIDEALTEVVLDFHNVYQRPFHVPAKLFGITRWVRRLHVKDLEGLKRFSETWKG